MTIMKKLGGMVATAVLGFASLAAQAGVTYFHNDVAGSPVAATNEVGAVIWRESYRPYGERRINSASASDSKVWFTSRRQDVDTGLVYMGARYYDPMVGRFISMDPVGFDEGNLHSHNRYAYANNNPYRYVDPDGRVPVPLVAAAVAAGRWAVQRVTTWALTRGAQASVTAAEIGAGEALGAGGVAVAASSGVKVTEQGLAKVESHLGRFGEDAANDVMLKGLKEGGRSTQELNFYIHELKEAATMARGVDAKAAHEATLKWQGIPHAPGYEAQLYSKEAIRAGGDSFSPAARRKAGLE